MLTFWFKDLKHMIIYFYITLSDGIYQSARIGILHVFVSYFFLRMTDATVLVDKINK